MSLHKVSFSLTARLAILVLSCVAIAGCSDGPTKPSIPERNLQPGGDGLTLSKAPSPVVTATPTGGEAEGFVEHLLTGADDFSSDETYAFNAESESEHQFPLAKGRLRWRSVLMFATTKSVSEIEAKIDCLVIVRQAANGTQPAGTMAWLSGPITRYMINGQAATPQSPDILVQVLDTKTYGKDQDHEVRGNRANDLAGNLSFSEAQGCVTMRPFPLMPTAHVEVHARDEHHDKH
jgi:hypothetical protein